MEIARKSVIALTALVSTAVVVSIPAAADGGVNGGYIDREHYPSIWQGLYAGVHVGFSDGDGILGGGQVGYNWQSGRVVYGLRGRFCRVQRRARGKGLQRFHLRPRQRFA